MTTIAVDGGWGWMVVVGSAICHFFLIGINRSMGLVYLLLREKFSITATQASLAASLFVSVRAFGGPLASKVTDRFGCRPVVMAGGVFLCIGVSFCAFVNNIIYVYILLGGVAGFGGIFVFSPSYIAVSMWFDKQKGKAMAFSTLGTGFGSIVMAPVISGLVLFYGYFGTMIVIGALLLNNSVGGALFRNPPKISNTTKDKEIVEEKDIVEMTNIDHEKQSESVREENYRSIDMTYRHSHVRKDFNNTESETKETNREVRTETCLVNCFRSSLWTNFRFLLYCCLIAAVQGCIQSVLVFLPGYGVEIGASNQMAAVLLTVFGAADMVGRFVFGFVFDMKPVRDRRSHVYLVITFIFGCLTVMMSFFKNYIVLAIAVAFVAIFEGGAHSQRATSVNELVEPHQMSIGVGLVICFQGGGNFYGPLVGGILRDSSKTYSWSFIFGGLILAVVSLVVGIHTYLSSRSRRSELANLE